MSRKSKDLEGQMVFTDLTENEENIQDVDYTEVMNQSLYRLRHERDHGPCGPGCPGRP